MKNLLQYFLRLKGKEDPDSETTAKFGPESLESTREWEALERTWSLSGQYKTGHQPADPEAAWQRLQGRIRAEEQSKAPIFRLRRVQQIAASLALLLLASWALWVWWPDAEGPYLEVITQEVAETPYRLPDGSLVRLFPGSKLTYPEGFAEVEKRTVNLEGQAYFAVSVQAGHPFIVHTAHTEIRVTGTRFLVSENDPTMGTRVDVEEGEVVFKERETADSLILNANTRGICIPGRTLAKKRLNPEERNLPARLFKAQNISLRDLQKELFRWNSVYLVLPNHLAECPISIGPVNLSSRERVISGLRNLGFSVDSSRPDTLLLNGVCR